jgi:protein regulator of cytokinesis 1
MSFGVAFKVESEVHRLDKLKVSKTKELVLKKQKELEKICLEAHMETNNTSQENMMAIIESGNLLYCSSC